MFQHLQIRLKCLSFSAYTLNEDDFNFASWLALVTLKAVVSNFYQLVNCNCKDCVIILISRSLEISLPCEYLQIIVQHDSILTDLLQTLVLRS